MGPAAGASAPLSTSHIGVSAPVAGVPGRSSATAGATDSANAGATATAGDVPPQNPSSSLPPTPDFTDGGACSLGALDDSDACNAAVVQAIDNARADLESMTPLSFDLTAFDAMTVPQQLFVIANVERSDRGLAPINGLTAQTAAGDNTDPDLSTWTLTGGASVMSWGSNWAGGTTSPLGSDYYWMYDDGPGSPNGACTSPSAPGCWGHRDNVLGTFSTAATCSSYGLSGAEQYMGAGYTASGTYGPSFTEILVGACGATPSDVVFTWAQAQQLLSSGDGPSPPGAPQDVTAVPSRAKAVVVSWQTPVDNGGSAITGYKVYRSRVSGSETLYATASCLKNTCTYANKQARAGKTFFYEVAAVNGAGTGPRSGEVSVQAR